MRLAYSSSVPVLLLAASVLSGCEEEQTPLELLAFEADRSNVDAGQTVNLGWNVTGATGISIWQTPGGELLSTAQATGNVESTPINLPTTFTLTATNAAGETVRRVAQVTVTGVNIVSFEADPPTIARGGSSVLRWNLGGSLPSEVLVLDSAGEEVVAPNQMRTGEVTVQPDQTETYTLRAQAGGVRAEAEATVTVTSQPPVVDTFEARALVGGTVQVVTTVARGTNLQLFWTLSNADQVQISANGQIIRPFTPNGAMTGNVQTRASEETNTFLLEACNGPMCTDITQQELVITTQDLPVVSTFSVTPTEYTGGSTVATAQWTTMGANGTLLQIDGQNVPNFPRELNGSYQFDVSGEVNVTLVARNAVGDASSTQRIRFGFNDREPNDNIAQAIPLMGDGIPVRGTVTSTTDVDTYALMVPEGASIYARVDPSASGSCNGLDPNITLLDATGQVLGRRTTAGLTRCAEMLPPEFAGFAERLTAGTYYLQVGRESNSMDGQYSLRVLLIEFGAPLPNVVVTRVGAPTWQVADFVNFSLAIGSQANMFAELFNNVGRILGDRHSQGGPEGVTFWSLPNVGSPSSFDFELQTITAVENWPSTTVFSREQWETPSGVAFAYTIVPAATATVGTSRDFPAAPGGPVIENGFFPISMVPVLTINGMAGGEPPPSLIVADPGLEGVSHFHVIHALTSSLFMAPPTLPATIQWTVSFRDNANAGYDIVFPFTVMN